MRMREVKEEIRQVISLKALIADYTPVSRNHAVCPFHTDKNPSLSISDSKGLWHCFGCGLGGDCFTFLMQAEGISFQGALGRLAYHTGISLPEISETEVIAHQRQSDQKIQKLRALEEEKKERKHLLDESSKFLGGCGKG